jgi:ATP-dependent DNA ligase
MLAMKFTELEVGRADALIEDDHYVVEQKFDGTRAIAVIDASHVRYLHAGGGILKHTAATQHLPKITAELMTLLDGRPGEIVLDGEIITGTGEYHVFDAIRVSVSGVTVTTEHDGFYLRRASLEALFDVKLKNGPVHLVRQAKTTAEKRDLLTAVLDAGGEGVMVKHIDGMYEPGQRVGHVLKVKFVKSADVVVTSWQRGHNTGSAKFAAYKDGVLTEVGGCSLIGKPEVEEGSVIEVNYLYFTGTSLYQPRLVRVREDKPATDCTWDQFPTYSREVV